MRIKQILETTTAGSVATVAMPMMTQTRENTNVKGLKPVQQVMKGKAVKKGPYANSIVESKLKDIPKDLKDLTNHQFQTKYKQSKAEGRADVKKVNEDDLAEQDLIIVPGQGRLRKTGFVKHDMDQDEHEGHTLKNSLHTIARAASDLDERLSVQSEFPEWVSEKIGAAKGMMVSVMDYLISSQEMQHDRDAMNEGEVSTSNLRTMYDLARMVKNYTSPEGQESLNELLKIIKWYMDQAEQSVSEGAGVIAGGLAYEDSDGGEQMSEMAMGELRNIAKNCKQIHEMLKQGKQLDTWEYSYITISNDHVSTVAEVLSTDSAEDDQLNEYTPLSGDLGTYIAAAFAAGKVGHAAYEWAKQKWKEHQKNKSMPMQGVAEDDSALQAFLSKGGNVQQLPYKKPRKADKTDYGSKHIGGGGDKMKASRTGTAANTQGSKVAGMREAFDLGDLRQAAASSRSPEDERALKRNPDFGKLMQKSVNKHNKAVVKTKQAIGSRIADIGAGGKEYNVKTDAAWDAAKKSVEESWKTKLGAAALAGAAALGGGSAQAQNAPSGYDNLPSIVAHVTFKVGDNTVTKDINLGTEYQTPGRASAALENFLKSKGIKFFNYTLQRAPAQEPLVSKDEMDASNQEYQRQHDSNNLSNTPYSATGDEPARLQTDKGYTSSSRPNASMTYEGKKVDRFVKHVEKSEEKTGKSKKDAENIAWATANKRGMLDNKNKKA